MSKSKLSFAEMISQAQVMVTALNANAEKISKRGIDSAFVTEMESIRTEAKKLNDEQEKLKADLKSKTDALTAKMEELTQKYSEAKKVVKLEFPQTQWMEFGISDKH